MIYGLLGKIWKVMPRGARIWVVRGFQVNFTASAGGIILNERGEVLLLNHILRPVSGWGVPGGFLEAGEQPEAAFRREVREETGLDVDNVSFVRARTTGRHIEFIFLARAIGTAEVKSREITGLGWFDIKNMPSGMSTDQHEMIRKAVLARKVDS